MLASTKENARLVIMGWGFLFDFALRCIALRFPCGFWFWEYGESRYMYEVITLLIS